MRESYVTSRPRVTMLSRQYTIDHHEWKYLCTSFERITQYSQVHERRDNSQILCNKEGIYEIQESRSDQEKTTLPPDGPH